MKNKRVSNAVRKLPPSHAHIGTSYSGRFRINTHEFRWGYDYEDPQHEHVALIEVMKDGTYFTHAMVNVASPISVERIVND